LMFFLNNVKLLWLHCCGCNCRRGCRGCGCMVAGGLCYMPCSLKSLNPAPPWLDM
jgi:hypothetical protein